MTLILSIQLFVTLGIIFAIWYGFLSFVYLSHIEKFNTLFHDNYLPILIVSIIGEYVITCFVKCILSLFRLSIRLQDSSICHHHLFTFCIDIDES